MRKLIFSFYFLLAIMSCCHSQNYSFRQYTTDDGLPTNYIYGVIEDDRGYIWMNTENGLSRFDGNNFRNYTTADGLPHNDVHYLHKDTSGTIYIQSAGKTAAYIEQDSIISLAFKKNQLTNSYNSALYTDSKHTFYKFNKNHSIDSFIMPQPSPNGLPKYEETFGWVNTNNTDYQGFIPEANTYFENKKGVLKQYPLEYNILNPTHPSKCFYSQTFSCVADLKGIFFINLETKEQFFYKWLDIFKTSLKRKVYTINYGATGELIVGTSEGFVIFDSNLNINKIFTPQNISDKYTLHRLFIDSQGNYWISTREGGVFFITQAELKTTLIQAAEPHDQLIERLIKRDTNLYAISDNSNIYKLKNNVLYTKYKAPFQSNFNDEIVLPNNDILIATGSNTPFIIDVTEKVLPLQKYPMLSSIMLYAPLNAKSFLNIKQVTYNANEEIIFYSTSYTISGTYSFQKSSKKTSIVDAQQSQIIYTDTFNFKSYFVQNNTILSYDNGALITELDSIAGVVSLFAKDKQHLWIGTRNDGLFEWNRNENKLLKISNRKYVRRIFKEDSLYYLASSEGLIKLEESDRKYAETYVYNKKDGLPSAEIYDVIVDNSFVYVAGNKGIAKIEKVTSNGFRDTIKRLKIQSLKVGGVATTWIQNQNLKPTENDIEINYHLLDYTSKGQIKYEYKLAPIQSAWISTTERRINFSALRPADYSFSLRATDLYGKTYLIDHAITFTIQEAVWQQLWFQILAIGSLFGLLYFIIKKREQNQEAKLAHEKTLNHQIANLQMESLRSQMNPHFIFNALGSIQYYIQTARTDEADDFLTMFARLMRKYLDSATELTINLRDEVNLLDEYTRLEMMRFEDQFDTKIIVNDNINLDQEILPSMLLQPFIENAINHGLQPRLDKGGELRVVFSKNRQDHLVCSISDNGIGRTNAGLNKNKNHKSRGLQNVYDRIETLRSNNISEIDLKIEDLNLENKTFPGTKILITIKNLDHEKI